METNKNKKLSVASLVAKLSEIDTKLDFIDKLFTNI